MATTKHMHPTRFLSFGCADLKEKNTEYNLNIYVMVLCDIKEWIVQPRLFVVVCRFVIDYHTATSSSSMASGEA